MLAALFTLPLLAAASAIVKRDGPAIQTAISYIQSNITQLNSTVNQLGYNDTIHGFIILLQTGDLQNAVTNAASVANSSAPLSESESGNVAFAVLNLEPNIFSLLDNIVAHKPEFQTALLGGDASFLVESNLKTSQQDADNFGAALTPKLTADYQGAAPQVISQIDAKFQEAIAAFA